LFQLAFVPTHTAISYVSINLVRLVSVILEQTGKGENNIALFAALKAGRYKESHIADFLVAVPPGGVYAALVLSVFMVSGIVNSFQL